MNPSFDHVILLADESANWKIAGLRQLERLVLALDEFATSISSQRKIDIFIFWRPDITAERRWQPQNPRLTRCQFVEALSVGARERVLSTRLVVNRRGLEQFAHDSVPLENDSTIGDEPAFWEKLWQRFENACLDSSVSRQSDAWRYLARDRDIARYERWLLRGSGKSRDGIVSRYLNRPISRAVSRLLLKTSITPNSWIWLITLFPVIGFFFLTHGQYAGFVIGAALFQIHSVLDGCDGEIARVKYLESERGARLDDLLDMLGSVLFVVGLGVGLSGTRASAYALEGLLCGAAIVANEWLLGFSKTESDPVSTALTQTLYPRHWRFIQHWPFSILDEKIMWWLIQFTKRDVAIFVFLLLALADRPQWILHLWIAVSAVTLSLSGRAHLRRTAARPGSRS